MNKKEDKVLINVRVLKELREAFHAKCAKHGYSYTKRLTLLMQLDIDDKIKIG